MHTLIIGRTGTGKSLLGKNIVKQYEADGINCIVLTPIPDSSWGASFITSDSQEFMDILFANEDCLFVIDEAGKMIGLWSGIMADTATMSRNFGHRGIYIAQRPKQIDLTVRSQCTDLYVFYSSPADMRDIDNEFVGEGAFLECGKLPKFEFLFKRGLDPVGRSKVEHEYVI